MEVQKRIRVKAIKPHVNWKNREHFRSELIETTQKVVNASDKLSHLDDRSYVNGVVDAMKQFPCNPVFDEVGEAYRRLNDLIRRLVHEEHIHIDLIRTITGPMLSRNNPAEITLTHRQLEKVIVSDA